MPIRGNKPGLARGTAGMGRAVGRMDEGKYYGDGREVGREQLISRDPIRIAGGTIL